MNLFSQLIDILTGDDCHSKAKTKNPKANSEQRRSVECNKAKVACGRQPTDDRKRCSYCRKR